MAMADPEKRVRTQKCGVKLSIVMAELERKFGEDEDENLEMGIENGKLG